jgi:hypothetical protein
MLQGRGATGACISSCASLSGVRKRFLRHAQRYHSCHWGLHHKYQAATEARFHSLNTQQAMHSRYAKTISRTYNNQSAPPPSSNPAHSTSPYPLPRHRIQTFRLSHLNAQTHAERQPRSAFKTYRSRTQPAQREPPYARVTFFWHLLMRAYSLGRRAGTPCSFRPQSPHLGFWAGFWMYW